MHRREFIKAIAGAAAAASPVAVRAQTGERLRRVGVLSPWPAEDAEAEARVSAFSRTLEQLGWTAGKNVAIDYRFGDGKTETMRKHAAQLIALAPDVILALSSAAVAPLLETNRVVPVVFAGVADPVAAGYVESLARPAGNATGFTVYEYSIGGKWLELLKEIAPRLTRAAVLRETSIAAGAGLFGSIQALAPTVGLELRAVNVSDAEEINRAVAAFAQTPNGGMIVSGGPRQSAHRELIIALAAKHRLPAIYNARFFAAAGGLVAYGGDFVEQSRLAAGYVDRILKGEKAGDLPVQTPTKYQLVINLKTANALGLTVPTTLLSRADEIIE
ncbi:MAG: ABC transporter substrate-binding protein [Bradyrhizobium sp.]|jgi:putative ABC transport system substrate-binding protein